MSSPRAGDARGVTPAGRYMVIPPSMMWMVPVV